jgi:hypothetical protein
LDRHRHNSVFMDEAGQWWTVYHAVDQSDPFYDFDPGFTKRPALLDPVDWINGWPVVNGGQMASDGKMPAPAAQEGQRSRYKPKLVKPQVVGQLLDRDEFSGTTLDGTWAGRTRPETGDATVAVGLLRWRSSTPTCTSDVTRVRCWWRDAPSGDYGRRDEGAPHRPAGRGLLLQLRAGRLCIYGDDDNFIKLSTPSIWETRQTEFAKELSAGRARPASVRQPVGRPARTGTAYLRIVRSTRLSALRQLRPSANTERYTAYTSQDGRTWVLAASDAPPKTASDGRADSCSSPLAAPAADTYTAEFDYVRVYSREGRSASATLTCVTRRAVPLRGCRLVASWRTQERACTPGRSPARLRLPASPGASHRVERAVEGQLRQLVGREEARVERVVSGGQGPADGLRLEGEEERGPARTGHRVDVDDRAHVHHQPGLLERLAGRRRPRVLVGVDEAGRQGPEALAGRDRALHQQQPAVLVVHHHADPHLGVPEVRPAAAGAGRVRARGVQRGAAGRAVRRSRRHGRSLAGLSRACGPGPPGRWSQDPAPAGAGKMEA